MIAPDQLLRLRAGYRLQFETAQQSWVLLFPEGMIRLNDSAGLILQTFIDQPQTADAVVVQLQQQFPDQDIRADVLEFLADAYEQRWLHPV